MTHSETQNTNTSSLGNIAENVNSPEKASQKAQPLKSLDEIPNMPTGPLTPSTLRSGVRYRASRLNGPYDAIVIGSGMGGLTTAACLSKLGKKVLVLEQHYTAGGFTHAYERNGYEWDIGVHYVGDIGHEGTLAWRLNEFISEGRLCWEPMDEHYDTFIIDGDEYSLKAGKQGFIDSLTAYFPQERVAIVTYIKKISECAKLVKNYALGKIAPWPVKAWLNYALNDHELMQKTTYDVLRELTQNERLIAVLTGQWGDLGLPPKTSSFMMHALIAKHYIYGGYYPIGGSSRIANSIIPTIQQNGGEVFTYARVNKIVIENERAAGVEMTGGEIIRSPSIISNAGVFNTFEKLVPMNTSVAAHYPQKLSSVKPSLGHLSLYIGLKADAQTLGLPKSNFWIYPSDQYSQDIENYQNNVNADFPVVYISFPSAKDPSWKHRHGDTATIEIIAPAPYEWFKSWEDKAWGQRGSDYESLKNHFSTRLMDILLNKMPHLAPFIDYYELSTPLSTQHFSNYKWGEMYGLDHSPQRFQQNWLKPKTPIKGLHLTGQDIFSCGVVGAMLAGLVCTVSVEGIKGMRLYKKIMNPSKQRSRKQKRFDLVEP